MSELLPENRTANVFWMPTETRWSLLIASALPPTIGALVDDTMTGIERENSTLKGVLLRLGCG